MARAVRSPRSEYRQSARRERAFTQTQRTLAHALRRLREERELTQEQAAERVGIHAVTYGRIERAELNPTLATLCALADAYKVALHDLLSPARAGGRRDAT